MERRRFNQNPPLELRLAEEAARLRKEEEAPRQASSETAFCGEPARPNWLAHKRMAAHAGPAIT